MLERMWSKGNTHPLLVGMQTCTTTLEISMAVSQKIGNQPTSGSSNITLWHIPKRCSIILQKHLFNYVHSSIIYKSQNLETTQMPLNWRMDKENVVHLHIRVPLSGKKQWHLEFCMQIDGIRKHYPKEWTGYLLIHKWILAINKGHWAYSSWS